MVHIRTVPIDGGSTGNAHINSHNAATSVQQLPGTELVLGGGGRAVVREVRDEALGVLHQGQDGLGVQTALARRLHL
jgi:hypothetical protein